MMRLLLSLAVLFAVAARGAQVTYHRLDLGNEGQYGIFSEDLDGDGRRDIVALAPGRISVYRADPRQEAGYSPSPQALVTGALALYADVADVLPDKGKEILILTADGIMCFVQEGGHFLPRPRQLIQCQTILSMHAVRQAGADRRREPIAPVLPWNFAFDADGDGRDDVIVPNDNGTDVYLQKAPGQFGKPITLKLFPFVYHFPPEGHKAGDLRERTARGIHIKIVPPVIESRDVNGDGKPDLLSGAHWFAQKLDGTFDPSPAVVPPDALQRDYWATPLEEFHIVDVDGDGKKDQLAIESTMDDPLSIVARVRVFLAGPDGALPAKQTQMIPYQNILIRPYTSLPVRDFNNDGAIDFAMLKTDISFTDIARWIRQCVGKIDGDLNFWLFDRRARAYSRTPTFTKQVSMRFKVDLVEAMMGLVWERYLGTMMRFEGDFNGDGLPDLLVRQETNTLALYFNTGKPDRLYGRDPDVVIPVKLDNAATFDGLALDDLNSDGASDLILYRGNYDDVLAAYISRRQ